jgi:hypothetical protein
MLGKITDVGLFTEKSEVTINHRSTADLVDSIRSKLHRLMHPENVTDVKAVEVNGQAINVDEELGLEENTTPPTEPVCEGEKEVFDDDPVENTKGQTEK